MPAAADIAAAMADAEWIHQYRWLSSMLGAGVGVHHRGAFPVWFCRAGVLRGGVAACEKTKTETALISAGFSTPSKAGIDPCRPFTSDSRIEARSEP